MSASISRHQLFTPQVLQRKQHSWLSVIVKACCNRKKQPGARGKWASWGPLGSCGKTLLHKCIGGLTRGIVAKLDPQLQKQNFANQIFAKGKFANQPMSLWLQVVSC